MNQSIVLFLIVCSVIYSTLAAVSSLTGTVTSSIIKDKSIDEASFSYPFEIQSWRFNVVYENLFKLTRRWPTFVAVQRKFDLSSITGSNESIGHNIISMKANIYNKKINIDNTIVCVDDNYQLDFFTVIDGQTKALEDMLLGYHKKLSEKLNVNAFYNTFSKVMSGSIRYKSDDKTHFDLSLDSKNLSPTISVAYSIDDKNVITPSISLPSGSMRYGYVRKYKDGRISTVYDPNDSHVAIYWDDYASSGTWNTKITVPLVNSIPELHGKLGISVKKSFNLE